MRMDKNRVPNRAPKKALQFIKPRNYLVKRLSDTRNGF